MTAPSPPRTPPPALELESKCPVRLLSNVRKAPSMAVNASRACGCFARSGWSFIASLRYLSRTACREAPIRNPRQRYGSFRFRITAATSWASGSAGLTSWWTRTTGCRRRASGEDLETRAVASKRQGACQAWPQVAPSSGAPQPGLRFLLARRCRAARSVSRADYLAASARASSTAIRARCFCKCSAHSRASSVDMAAEVAAAARRIL